MPITDPRAIKFSNEVVRPLSERCRDLFEDIARAEKVWTDEVGALIPNDASVLEDGREAEGVSRLSGAEITLFMGVLAQLRNLRNGAAVATTANVDTKVAKACVRTLRS